MQEFAAHVQGKKVVAPNVRVLYTEQVGIKLDDGTVCVAQSRWDGPWSEHTPDIDAMEPAYYLGVPNAAKQ
jgi:hypothetical protein